MIQAAIGRAYLPGDCKARPSACRCCRNPRTIVRTNGEALWKPLSPLSRWSRSLPARPSLSLRPATTLQRAVTAAVLDRAPPAIR